MWRLLARIAGLFSAIGLALFLFRSRLCRWLGCNSERITIATPAASAQISSPLSITGWGRATQHNQLGVEVRDSSNVVIGSGTASISAALGQPGPFNATVSFTPAAAGTPGVVQVFDSSPATGAITHLASAFVTFA